MDGGVQSGFAQDLLIGVKVRQSADFSANRHPNPLNCGFCRSC
nr:MAG TPA: hypothetical protein [Caudoviricetes sp.]